MPHPDADKWNAVYLASMHVRNEPVRVLKDHSYLLPKSGTALDLACGTGVNAIFLAQHGLQTFAWDISEQAIKQLRETVNRLHLNIHTEIRNVIDMPPEVETFDVITISYFLERTLMPYIINALRMHGLLFYQTFLKERVDDTGPTNDAYRLAENELLELCAGLHIVKYLEEGMIGNVANGFRNEAMLIGQRR
ncbi:MAG: class I SAM-dependent methyltransferase [Gammaproteobacteria bacterium]|nr:class I SAM-dependent methyltransferase [Gammaproteobacteria bacterium]